MVHSTARHGAVRVGLIGLVHASSFHAGKASDTVRSMRRTTSRRSYLPHKLRAWGRGQIQHCSAPRLVVSSVSDLPLLLKIQGARAVGKGGDGPCGRNLGDCVARRPLIWACEKPTSDRGHTL